MVKRDGGGARSPSMIDGRCCDFVVEAKRIFGSLFSWGSLLPPPLTVPPQMAKYLSQGGDVNKPNKLGDTPLHEVRVFDEAGARGEGG